MNKRWQSISLKQAKQHPLYGFNIWLMLLIVCLIWRLVTSIAGYGDALEVVSKAMGISIDQAKEVSLPLFDFVKLNIAGNVLGLLVICSLMLMKNKYFRIATTTLIALSWPYTALIAMAFEFPGAGHWIGESLIIFVIYSVIWIAYLNISRSIRVTFENTVLDDDTYSAKVPEEHAPTTSSPSRLTQHTSPYIPNEAAAQNMPYLQVMQKTEQTPVRITASNSEEIWARALAEFESDNRRAGLWAQMYAEADGDEATAKARYLKTRATELTTDSEIQAAQLQAELERQVLLAELALLASVDEEKRLAALAREQDPKGECPNCKKIIYLDLSSCPKCKAVFKTESGEPTNWAIKPLSAFETATRSSTK